MIIIKYIYSLIIILLINTSYASTENIIVKGHIIDNNWITINWINVSISSKDGKEVCKTMSKQVYSYSDINSFPESKNIPEILKIPKLQENWYVELNCKIWANEIKESKLFIHEGTFLNIEGWIIEVPFNEISTISMTWNIINLTIWKNIEDNYRLILKKRNNGRYYDFLRVKKYEALPNDLRISWSDINSLIGSWVNIENNIIQKFTIKPIIEWKWNGDVMPIKIDNLDYNITRGDNIISFDKIWKFEKDIVSVKVEIKDFWYEKTIFIKNGEDVVIKLPNISEVNKNIKYASVYVTDSFKNFIFENSDLLGFFWSVWTFDNWRIINYKMDKKALQVDKNWNFIYTNLCELSDCPIFLNIFEKQFILKDWNYLERNKNWQFVEIKKEKKNFLTQADAWYKIFFFMFIIFIIWFITFSYRNELYVKFNNLKKKYTKKD